MFVRGKINNSSKSVLFREVMMLGVISRKLVGWTVLLVLVGTFVGVTCVTQVVQAETLIWDTDFCRLQFEWTGSWDNVAYWAYGLYVLDVPDWAYLFGIYGMGWDHVWGSGFWGTDGVWGPDDKLTINVVSSGLSHGPGYGLYFDGPINLDVSQFGTLDLAGGGWVNTICTAGRTVAFYATMALYDKYVNYDPATKSQAPAGAWDVPLSWCPSLADLRMANWGPSRDPAMEGF